MTSQGKTKFGLAVGVLAASLVLAACDDGSMKSDLRVIHASDDAPTVNVNVGKKTVISDLNYAESSGYVEVRSGTRKVVVEANILGGNADVITVKRFEFERDSRYNILAINKAANIDALVVEESAANPGIDEVAIAVVHAAPVAGEVEIFVTGPNDPITAAAPIVLDYKGVADAGPLPAGEYRIRVTLGGTLVFDSGSVDLSGFAGDKLLIAALNSANTTEASASPIKLLAANDIAQVTLVDETTQVGARVLHLSPDAGLVDVLANGGLLIPDFAYTDEVPGGSNYLPLPVGEYTFDIEVQALNTPNAPEYTATLSLAGGVEYSVIALGNALDGVGGPGAGTQFGLLPIVDDNRPLAGLARVNVLHGAPGAGLVDVYVTPAGDFSAADVQAGIAGDPLLRNFAFGTLTDYLAIPPGNYDIRILQKSTGAVPIDVPGVTLVSGLVATVIARQPDGTDNDPADFNLILLTNAEAMAAMSP